MARHELLEAISPIFSLLFGESVKDKVFEGLGGETAVSHRRSRRQPPAAEDDKQAGDSSMFRTSYRAAGSPHLGSRFRFLNRESCLRSLVF